MSALVVTSINVEGYTKTKAEVIASYCSGNDIICMQETHLGLKSNRPTLPGMKLVAEIRHPKDIYTNSSDTNIETVTVCLPEISITSLYKPPASPFVWPDIPTKCRKKYAVVIGDFNSHHTRWGYDNTNRDGELVESWMENTNMELELIHDAKLPKSFNSCRWRKGYNPDLCFISKRLAHLSEKAVLNPLPKSQHRPISITIKPAITKTEVPFRRRFNLKKAKWTEYSEGMERALLDVEPTPDNYTMFVQAVKKTACACIPCGCRKEYIAGLTEESLQLLESYETEFGNDPFSDTTSELGDALTESLGRERRKAWQDLIENINMTQNSKKAWSTIRKLNGDKITPPSVSDITPNQVGSQLVANGRRAETRRAKGEHHSTVIPAISRTCPY
ncbi:hypothetical protein AAFF_G00245530 [Aldrovandia affinis]|uniref:Endonuclease/exonuclease/phosphatase domain-containing protein n=1 Tax=Aldrovandia affinis TaxID=143900 RepID=A0AAD7RDI1_9TELE|nr:hypothetical protein AAFF_G00245530 [Aldrovandia affinis]